MSEAKILVVDDEPDHLAIVQRWLEDEGYEVVTATNGWDGLEALAENRPDLTITDIRMPQMDGFQFIKRIREISDGHVMALTRMSDEEDVMHGLQLGADEYLSKPISKRMFLVRVSSILRRALTPEEIPTDYSDTCLSLSFLTHNAKLHDEELSLRPLEFRLLAYLARNNDRVVNHDEILDSVWGSEEGSKDNLRWFIASLRQKLDDACKDSHLITTFPKVGYRYQSLEVCNHLTEDKAS
ncbi:MAG: response regulator transcription factor [Chloroflexi bacterium]|nr:response regulator transcription factor [Chloroflexota bacterium]